MNKDQLDAHDAHYIQHGYIQHPATGVELDQALFEATDLAFTPSPLETEMRDFTLALWKRGFAIVALNHDQIAPADQ